MLEYSTQFHSTCGCSPPIACIPTLVPGFEYSMYTSCKPQSACTLSFKIVIYCNCYVGAGRVCWLPDRRGGLVHNSLLHSISIRSFQALQPLLCFVMLISLLAHCIAPVAQLSNTQHSPLLCAAVPKQGCDRFAKNSSSDACRLQTPSGPAWTAKSLEAEERLTGACCTNVMELSGAFPVGCCSVHKGLQ